MDVEKINHMKSTLIKGSRNQFDPIWKEAFEEYNRFNKPLRMKCRICYYKVLEYIIAKNK